MPKPLVSLPSELKLLEDFNVSRMTVHRALRELTEEGLLTRVQGVGTFVAEQAARMDALELRAVSDEITARGNRHSCRVDLLEDIIADGTLAEVAARFSNGEPNVNLEEVFIRATGGTED